MSRRENQNVTEKAEFGTPVRDELSTQIWFNCVFPGSKFDPLVPEQAQVTAVEKSILETHTRAAEFEFASPRRSHSSKSEKSLADTFSTSLENSMLLPPSDQ